MGGTSTKLEGWYVVMDSVTLGQREDSKGQQGAGQGLLV